MGLSAGIARVLNSFLPTARQGSTAAQWEDLKKGIDNIEDIRALSQSRGWLKLVSLMMARINNAERKKDNLFREGAQKNEVAIAYQQAYIDSLMGFIELINTTLQKENTVREKLGALEEIIVRARIDKMKQNL